MSDHLPHEEYITDVCERLGEIGVEVADGITTTPDGEILEAAISFERSVYSIDAWPDGVYLSWDHREGWSLCNEGESRNLHPLDLDAYANPRAVARRAADRLVDASDNPVDEHWDGAVELQDAVERWEVNSQ